MKHERMRELLALRLYDEIEPEEQLELASHLASCIECARFAGELDSGLGRLREEAARAADAQLPAGWDARLAAATSAHPRSIRARDLALVAAGIAAGVLLVLAWSALRPAPEASTGVARLDAEAPAFLRFRGDAPPPPATGGGPAARYLAWQTR